MIINITDKIKGIILETVPQLVKPLYKKIKTDFMEKNDFVSKTDPTSVNLADVAKGIKAVEDFEATQFPTVYGRDKNGNIGAYLLSDVDDNAEILEKIKKIEEHIGDMDTLDVQTKTNIVEALNALDKSLISGITFDKDTKIMKFSFKDSNIAPITVDMNEVAAAIKLNDLSDVTISSDVENNHIIRYDDATKNFVNDELEIVVNTSVKLSDEQINTALDAMTNLTDSTSDQSGNTTTTTTDESEKNN